MKATEWKTLFKDICQRNEIQLKSGFNQNLTLVCLCTKREWIKLQSDWLLIDLVTCSKREWMWLCVCVRAWVYVRVLSWLGQRFQVGLAKILRCSQGHKQITKRLMACFFFFCQIISSHEKDHHRYQRCTHPSPFPFYPLSLSLFLAYSHYDSWFSNECAPNSTQIEQHDILNFYSLHFILYVSLCHSDPQRNLIENIQTIISRHKYVFNEP